MSFFLLGFPSPCKNSSMPVSMQKIKSPMSPSRERWKKLELFSLK